MQIIATHPALELCPRNRQNPRKLGAAAAALPHRHHLIIRLGAGPIQFVTVCVLFALALGRRGNFPSQNAISTIFARFFRN